MTLLSTFNSNVTTLFSSGGRRPNSDEGDTLIEILVTMVIISLCVVAFLSAFTTSISASAEHGSLVSMDAVLRSTSEEAISQIQLSAVPLYTSCATPASYGGIDFGAPAGYSASVTSVEYWNGSSFSSTCPAGSTSPQLIVLTVSSPLGSTSSISFTVDDPQYSATAASSASLWIISQSGDAIESTRLTKPNVPTYPHADGNFVPVAGGPVMVS